VVETAEQRVVQERELLQSAAERGAGAPHSIEAESSRRVQRRTR
jgi:hypothetical protein